MNNIRHKHHHSSFQQPIPTAKPYSPMSFPQSFQQPKSESNPKSKSHLRYRLHKIPHFPPQQTTYINITTRLFLLFPTSPYRADTNTQYRHSDPNTNRKTLSYTIKIRSNALPGVLLTHGRIPPL